MALLVLTVMVFLVTLGLLVSGLYFFVETPAAKKRMRARLGALQQISTQSGTGGDTGLLRDEVMMQLPAIDRLFLRLPLLNRLQLFLDQASIKLTIGFLVSISIAAVLLTFLVTFLLNLPVLLILGGSLAAGTIPLIVVAIMRQRRFSKFEEQFPDAIDMLARAVRAGHAFTTALELIAKEMPEPLAGEFRLTYEQQNFGMPLKDALNNLTVRMPLADVRFFSSALQIQRESGGNLAEILDNLAQVIRDRFKILRQVRVFTAQGRMTLYLLMALTPGFTLLMYLRNPKYIGRLFTDPLGFKFLMGGVGLQILGFLIIRKIIRIKV